MHKSHIRRKLRAIIISAYLVFLLVMLAKPGTAQTDSDSRWLTPTMINARANMFDPKLNFLIFRNLDKMFATRTVPAGEKVWKLPYSLVSIEGKFKFEGSSYELMDGPESVGREFFGGGFNATLRDYGRFGLLMLNRGMANGKQVVPSDWVQKSTVPDEGHEPIAGDETLGYKYQWWTMPNSEAYLAIGLHNQFIYIDPKNNTVIVKLSYTPGSLGWEAESMAFFQKVSAILAR